MSNVQQAFKFAPQQIVSFQITPYVNLFNIYALFLKILNSRLCLLIGRQRCPHVKT